MATARRAEQALPIVITSGSSLTPQRQHLRTPQRQHLVNSLDLGLVSRHSHGPIGGGPRHGYLPFEFMSPKAKPGSPTQPPYSFPLSPPIPPFGCPVCGTTCVETVQATVTDGSSKVSPTIQAGNSRGQVTSTTTEVIRWYAYNTHRDYTLAGGFGVWSCGKCFSEPNSALPALLHATLRERERMQLQVLYTRNVKGLGRAVCAVLRG